MTYTSGGSTPGDSYVWILDENKTNFGKNVNEFYPLAARIYLENYKTLESGALVAQDHWLLGRVNDIQDLN